jgi:aspartyl-tRNA synthetase
VGAKGMVYARVEADGNVKSSVDKFYSQEVLQEMAKAFNGRGRRRVLREAAHRI